MTERKKERTMKANNTERKSDRTNRNHRNKSLKKDKQKENTKARRDDK